MHAGEVVVHEVQRDRVLWVRPSWKRHWSSVRSAHAHAHREVLALDVARGDMRRVWFAYDARCRRTNHLSRAVPSLFCGVLPLELDEHGIVNVRTECPSTASR